MSNTYVPANKMWTLDSTGALWTNTLGTASSNTNGPKWVTRIILFPNAASDSYAFQDAGGGVAFTLKAGPTDASPVTIDWSAENGGKGRRFHSLSVSARSTSATAHLFLA